jgi:hypothetical protein
MQAYVPYLDTDTATHDHTSYIPYLDNEIAIHDQDAQVIFLSWIQILLFCDQD